MSTLFNYFPKNGNISIKPNREKEFIDRARPPTPAAFTKKQKPDYKPRDKSDRTVFGRFTRRKRKNVVVPLDNSFEKLSEEKPQKEQDSADLFSLEKEREPFYTSEEHVNLGELNDVKIVGDKNACCIPGKSNQICRVCPEKISQTFNPSIVQQNNGGRKRKHTIRRKPLKKRHYKKLKTNSTRK